MLPALLLQTNDCVVVDQGSPMAWDNGVYCASPSIRSAPAPPSIVSAPAPPNSTSLRRLPCRLSAPASPLTQSPRLSLSAAVAAFSASLSRPPQTWSSPAPPISTSDSSPPKAISLSVAVGLVPVAPGRMKSRPAPPITLSSPGAVLTYLQPASGIDHIRIGAALKGIASAAPAKAHAPGGLGAIERHVVCTQGKMQQYAVRPQDVRPQGQAILATAPVFQVSHRVVCPGGIPDAQAPDTIARRAQLVGSVGVVPGAVVGLFVHAFDAAKLALDHPAIDFNHIVALGIHQGVNADCAGLQPVGVVSSAAHQRGTPCTTVQRIGSGIAFQMVCALETAPSVITCAAIQMVSERVGGSLHDVVSVVTKNDELI